MVTKDEAKRYLCDAAPEQCFWINNGPILKNIEELANALPGMAEDTFRHHVNNEKNDFSSWVRDVIGDQKLANELASSKNRDSALKKIRNRLNSLKKKAG
ncbi:hypothetical protein J4204_06240 [Candidatus Woesearchaeota archaeon]|nr:hypothetical protein [Candidatus Woesearchaeota archaeon]